MSLGEHVPNIVTSHWGWLGPVFGAIGTFIVTGFGFGVAWQKLLGTQKANAIKIDSIAAMIGHLNTQMSTEADKREEHMALTQKNAVDIANIKGKMSK